MISRLAFGTSLLAASVCISANEAHADGEGIAELSNYVTAALPIVAAFEGELATSDRADIASLATEDFHVVSRSDWDTKLGIEALYAYIDGCEPAGRMSANEASITITHACDGYDYRYVLYNVRDGKVSRVVIGATPTMQVRREN